jgi:hypothetical protein
MRLAPALGFALLALGSAALSVALLDYLAYEFAFVELVAERGLSRYWWPGPGESLPSRSLLVLTLFAGTAAFGAFALARVRRTAGGLLALAAGCSALQLVVAVASAQVARARQLAETIGVDPDTSITWLERGRLGWYTDAVGVQGLVGTLASMTILATALASVRVALRRGWSHARAWSTAALALPPLLATGALAKLWDEFGMFRPPDWGHEDWVTLVQSARWAIVAAALVVAAAGALLLRGQPRPRLVLAAGLCALGLAAVAVTAPHRRVIDGLYPLPRFGAHAPWLPRLEEPWDFDGRVTGGCVDAPSINYAMVVRLDADGVVEATINGGLVSLAGEPADVRAAIADRLYYPRGVIALFADRRIPVATLMPLFELLPSTEIGRVVVAGIATAELTTAEGPRLGWRGCAIGVLHLPTLLRTRFAPDTTWGQVIDDPALVSAPEAP